MADDLIKLDIGSLEGMLAEVKERAQETLERAAADLAVQTHSHIVEQVQEKLRSTRELYLQALGIHQQGRGSWVIQLNPKANWIEDGKEPGEMIDDLLGNKGKLAKDGSRYRIIPFRHNNAPTRMTQAAQDLRAALQTAFKKEKIPWGKLETNPDGTPKVGKLHKLDVMDKPIKVEEGPGQGHGPIGEVRQGMTGIPLLQGVNVYQSMAQFNGKLMTQKNVMTFRIVSSKHKGTGRWMHPGTPARGFFEDAKNWALAEWENHIRPSVLKEIAGKKG